MIELGKTHTLPIARFADFGAFLDGGEDTGEILLPGPYIPDGVEVGDELRVFVHRDSEDRLLATTEVPKVEVGQCAYLEVSEVNDYGAFLDWGLPKELFLPFGEQRRPVTKGEWYVIYVYVDNTERIAATTKLNKFIDDVSRGAVKAGDKVDLLVTRQTDLGVQCVVNNTCFGMIFHSDLLQDLSRGDSLEGYVKEVRKSGKVDLSMQPVGSGIEDDLESQILAHIRVQGGSTDITDKSSSDEIFEEFGVSKKKFKRAVGGLYKARKIVLEPGVMRIPDDS